MSRLYLYSDGASRGNPGPAGIGVVISDTDGNVVKEVSEYIGETTNNIAEYSALIRGLEECSALGGTEVEVKTDSELLARQISGVYRVKAKHLIPLMERVRSLLGQFKRISISHVMREQNRRADELARLGVRKKPVM